MMRLKDITYIFIYNNKKGLFSGKTCGNNRKKIIQEKDMCEMH